MGTGKLHVLETQEYEETRNLLLRCLQVLRDNPDMPAEKLLSLVRDEIAVDMLARKTVEKK
jgi:hypothetical protein